MKIVMPLADGLEEIEAIVPLDVMRRAGLDVTTVHIRNRRVVGSHSIAIEADESIDNIEGASFGAVVCPGGMPGSDNLKQDNRVINLVQEIFNHGGYAAAICAAPRVLFQAGILNGKTVTCFPGTEKLFDGSVTNVNKPVVVDGKVITAIGAGAAYQFAYTLVRTFLGEDASTGLQKKMMYRE